LVSRFTLKIQGRDSQGQGVSQKLDQRLLMAPTTRIRENQAIAGSTWEAASKNAGIVEEMYLPLHMSARSVDELGLKEKVVDKNKTERSYY
jgi:hypothetical protein